jgi:hypothetical protein
MSYPTPSLQVSATTSEHSRQRLMAAVLSHTSGIAGMFATPQQQHYLAQYQRGRLTIDEVVYYLEATASK